MGLNAPCLIDAEFAQTLRRLVKGGHLGLDRDQVALHGFLDAPITRYPHENHLQRVWELRENLTAYDALYVSVAESLNSPLLTLDKRIAGCPGLRVPIIVP